MLLARTVLVALALGLTFAARAQVIPYEWVTQFGGVEDLAQFGLLNGKDAGPKCATCPKAVHRGHRGNLLLARATLRP